MKAYFLIDTGNSKSSSIAYKFYRNFIESENFNIQTAHGMTCHNEIINIPAIKIFNISGFHKFYLFKFSNKFDGLIGADMIQQLDAEIKLKRKTLTTPHATIPIFYGTKKITKTSQNLCNYHSVIIPPRT